MQNTRINRLIDVLGDRFRGWLSNPWRRISLLIISLLFGTFLGTAISTIAGQSADWDIIAAGLLVLLTELVNWLVYGGPRPATGFFVGGDAQCSENWSDLQFICRGFQTRFLKNGEIFVCCR
ncbi:DUF565 domain-containing protein [Microcoleus vaginatus]|uniref:DUF565 domain-containing protein n=1 Tax=Microcoleus vaginatus TaxID=119532 RepID=UPI00403F6678